MPSYAIELQSIQYFFCVTLPLQHFLPKLNPSVHAFIFIYEKDDYPLYLG